MVVSDPITVELRGSGAQVTWKEPALSVEETKRIFESRILTGSKKSDATMRGGIQVGCVFRICGKNLS